ncbi:hypothetical protein H072_8277 [Dactylellina haptotyla CBS 200.50]|uniref:MARVEL domain-containing protein n=1 Tax=Dactylellina haptotyla (strain CBS 200.50) TaxID=1284197 RepID=S8A4S7_DACHA|nr:hypothetical protein H072_8277 [Dactylellina haptotyla CBS 200.50]
MNPCITILLRLAQLVFAAIVLALSVVLLLGQRAGDAPIVTKYSIAAGALGMFMAIFGVLSQIFVALRGSKIVGALDFLTALVGFAGGAAMAAQLGPGVNSCSNKHWREQNALVNGGYVVVNGQNFVYRDTPFYSRCQMSFAITAFEFLIGMTFVLSGIGLMLTSQRKKTPTPAKW